MVSYRESIIDLPIEIREKLIEKFLTENCDPISLSVWTEQVGTLQQRLYNTIINCVVLQALNTGILEQMIDEL